ncbi:hypothetical protein A1O3_09819 [Capronia epimyces CBS 606.96]|uniref:Peroxin-11B n=1 Tax=Capronia epimyces CBS 606.96 TaxID=1182542 RepID=W9XAS7_9EURO|nr:uncharacterized protein A1O3_09819 [Capronia epimyces CBS 606.96]EXJ77592.1 hypothetical protein A1O3_09819 [Capronia epimyces CBS 606.96]
MKGKTNTPTPLLSGGIEKTLKLLQSVSQIGESIGDSSPTFVDLAQWTTAKNQFALARRYFRLFKWIDCFTVANAQYQAFGSTQPKGKDKGKGGTETATKTTVKTPEDPGDNFRVLLSVSKWSFLGIYLFLEMFTITNALSLTSYSWGPTVQIEALKFWAYSLAVSVILGIYELFQLGSDSTPTPTTEPDGRGKHGREEKTTLVSGREEKTTPASSTTSASRPPSSSPGTSRSSQAHKRRAIYKQIVSDGCDLLIPASAVGWISLDPVTLGVAGSISAVLGASEVWARVNP